MSKKTATIIIVVFILILVGGLLAFYFYSNQGQGGGIGTTDTPSNIFPGGGGGEQPAPENTDNPTTPLIRVGETSEGQAAPVLKELSTRPSAGAVGLATSSNQTPTVLVRFVERGTGNVYEVRPDTGGETRLSNTTVPKIAEVFWNGAGTKIIARYVKDGTSDTIQTYAATLNPPAAGETEGSLSGAFLTENIRAVAENPEQNKVFYLLNHSEGSTGIIAEFDGSKKTQVFDSLLSEWIPEWPTSSIVALTTKASAGAPGFLYLLNTKTGTLKRAISGIAGLSTLVDPAGANVLYSQTDKNGLSLRLYSFKTASVQNVSVQTFPEKCVWSKNEPETLYCAVPSYLPQGDYPDAWYRGVISFSDDIWKIDASNGTATLVIKLRDSANRDIDTTNLFLSPKEEYLFFTDKKDFHLWSLALTAKP